MGSVSFGGLMSGMDTRGLIDKLVNASSRPILLMQREQVILQGKKSLITDITSKLEALGNASRVLTLDTTFQAFKSTSSDTSVIDASVASTYGVQEGAITIDNITSQASFQRQVISSTGTPISDADAYLDYADATTLTITSYTSEVSDVSISVDSTTTLNELAAAINNAAGNSLVSASVINISADEDNPEYKLILKAKNTGLSDFGGAQTRGFDASELETQSTLFDTVSNSNGTDAQLDIDGVTVTRSTNTFTNVLNGLTFTLKDLPAAGTQVQVTTSRDTDALVSKINTLVDAYNNVVTTIGEQYKLDEETESLGLLGGDNSFKRIQKDIQMMITGYAGGLRPGYHAVTGFADIGFETDEETGEVSFNSSTFTSLYGSERELVEALFLEESSIGGIATEGIAEKVYSYVSGLTEGFNDPIYAKTHESIMDAKVTSLEREMEDIEERIARQQSSLEAMRERLTAQFNAMESLISGMQSQGNMLNSFFSSLSNNQK
ncbi:MAG: hypothetical protein A2284_16930 [Deltaproteobacteria bacterium RIFOXYA12_FULL_61_11]|nr:MAG: hypothetical protein A2284_16930 [Deltaproteobacteria bacterium RIFOXYA12_FULL_61_11]